MVKHSPSNAEGTSSDPTCHVAWPENKTKQKSEVLLYSTDNYTQYPVINQNGKEYEKESMYV